MGADIGMIVFGIVAGGILSLLGFATEDMGYVISGIIFGGFFVVFGILRLYFGQQRRKEIKTGMVVGYEDGGKGRITLLIQAEGNTYRATTAVQNRNRYPLGTWVTFNMLGEIIG